MAKESDATLIVAKIDRLARDAEYFLHLINSGIEIVFCDMPDVPEGAAGKLMLTQMAAFAEFESNRASERTCAAAAVVRRRGGPWGDAGREKIRERARQNALSVKAIIDVLMDEGFMSNRDIARELNQQGIPTPNGKRWHPTSVARTLERIAI